MADKRPSGWAEPVAKGGLRGGGLLDGFSTREGRRCDEKLLEEMASIIEEIIQKIIASKENVWGADEEVTCDDVLEMVVLEQPQRGWKEVLDEVFPSQDAGNVDVRSFSFHNQMTKCMLHHL